MTIKNNTIEKLYMESLVGPIHSQKKVYKYLTFDSGIMMLNNTNIQFTRADKLNDWLDCNVNKIDYNSVTSNEEIKRIIKEHDGHFFNSLGICSLGTSAYNETLWNRYTYTNNLETGMSIELDTNSVIHHFIQTGKPKYGFIALFVKYDDDIIQAIDRILLEKNKLTQQIFFSKMVTTKNARIWKDEDEIRFILMDGIGDNEYFREVLPSPCITKVFLGKDMSPKQKEIINLIVKNKLHEIDVVSREIAVK